jgi:acetaldehyde dehydrogenase (acetylating)
MGVEIVDVLLHVGLGTFRPVKTDDILSHHMHSEYYEISKEAADKINQAKVRNIVYATQAYINRYRITKEVRFDIVVVIVDMEKGRVCKIDWLKDAFLPPVNM